MSSVLVAKSKQRKCERKKSVPDPWSIHMMTVVPDSGGHPTFKSKGIGLMGRMGLISILERNSKCRRGSDSWWVFVSYSHRVQRRISFNNRRESKHESQQPFKFHPTWLFPDGS